MVEFDLDNRSASTSNVFLRLFTIDPPVREPSATDLLSGAGQMGSPVASTPDMPERMIAAWEWPSAVSVPRQLRLKITSQIHKSRDNLYGAPGWFDRDPVAIVALGGARAAGGHEQHSQGLRAVVYGGHPLWPAAHDAWLWRDHVSHCRRRQAGERADASAFAIGVAKVHFARTVTTKGVGRTHTFTTSGVWVLVEGAAEARPKASP